MTEPYITEVELINFQSHLHTKVKLTPGMNLFVGTSDSGKSALIRGLIWNMRNEPAGDEFIRKGTTTATAITHWSHGYSIERTRGGNKNFYALFKDGELISEYTGFGTKVPPEIIEVHGVVPLSNGSYFNYADQLESAFMISDSPKVRAETIGNLDELGRIDEELVKINDDIKSANKEKKRTNAEITELQKEIDALERTHKTKAAKIQTLAMLKEAIVHKTRMVEQIEKHLERVHEIHEDINRHTIDIQKASRILTSWDETLPNKIQTSKNLSDSLSRLLKIESELSEINFMNEEKIKELSELSHLIQSSVLTFQNMNQMTNRLKEIKDSRETIEQSIAHRTAVIDFSHVDKDVEKFKFIFNNLNRLEKIKQDIELSKNDVWKATDAIITLSEDFMTALQNAKVCPTCSQSTGAVCTHDLEKIL